ncbi:MAG: hypothetical protein HY304_03690 [candidate division Zixibacteria bacterium]|nr:hypothetical protein [candidate division Zixibacteria bacterium]
MALYARTATNLALSYADPPYTAWLSPADFVTESANQPFSALMDSGGNLYVAYTQQTTDALRCVKLVYTSGTWGTQTPVTVYDSGTSSNKFASILKDAYNRIWIVWARDDAGVVSQRVKYSNDDALTFGSGSADAGTDLSGATTSAYGLLIARANYIHCLFAIAGTTLKNRAIDLDAAFWGSPDTLYTGTGLGADLSAAVGRDGMLGALFSADGQLYLKEFDGAVWGALQTVSSQTAQSPSLRYIGTAPYALFLHSLGTDQNQLYESHRVGGAFAAAVPVLSQETAFASVFCLDADAGTPYADLTAPAAGGGGADVFHPASGALVKSFGDALFLGLDDRFSFARIMLSTTGTVGAVTWSYWNGSAWTNFIPNSGSYNFDAAAAGVRLFSDGTGTPADWQKTVINGANRYWIRAVVAGAFTVAPIGSQITAVPKAENVILRRD